MTPQQYQKKIRIQLSVWAYAYEVMHDPLVSDNRFDSLAKEVDLSIPTDNPEMDSWFKDNFAPFTGGWVHIHPHYNRLATIYHSCIRYRDNH